ARAPAGEGDGDGGPLRQPSRRRAADPVRPARRRTAARGPCGGDPEAVLADPAPRHECAAGWPGHGGPVAASAGGDRVLVVPGDGGAGRSEEHTSELQSRENLVCRLLLEKNN